MSDLLQFVAHVSIATFLLKLVSDTETQHRRNQLEDFLTEAGDPAASATLDDLVERRLIQRIGEGFMLSRRGARVALLVDALQSGNVEGALARIRRLDGLAETYEIVRQGMTTRFLETLVARPRFGRLYFCSPWINPSEREAAIIKYAALQIEKTSGRRAEIFVITRSPDAQPESIRTGSTGLKPFVDIGAKIFLQNRLHSKLYIREPDESGGSPMAIVGSENFTRSNNLELGIQINGDGRVITGLIAHFHELTSYAQEH